MQEEDWSVRHPYLMFFFCAAIILPILLTPAIIYWCLWGLHCWFDFFSGLFVSFCVFFLIGIIGMFDSI